MSAIRFERGEEGFLEPVLEFPPGAVTVYVAGPEGFSSTTRGWMEGTLIPVLEAIGFTVISPWELTSDEEIAAVMEMPLGEARLQARQAMNRRIAARNERAMCVAHCCTASLVGEPPDCGTTSEVAAFSVMHNYKRTIIGFRDDLRCSGEEGSVVNLQVVHWIERTCDGSIVTNLVDLTEAATALYQRLRSQVAAS